MKKDILKELVLERINALPDSMHLAVGSSDYSKAEREKIIREAIRGANEDQRLLVEKYNKLQHKAQ